MSGSPDTRKPFSIGHVAKVTGVSVSTLRSWENLGLIEPHKSAGGHRSFTADDIDRVHRIEQMRRLNGQSLSSIRRLLDEEVAIRADVSPETDIDRRKIDFDKIGARVREMRKEANLSLRELSERTEIGVSHLSMFERGVAFLSPARLNAIAEVFGRSLAELLGGTSHDHLPIVRRGGGRIVGTFGPGVIIEQLTVAERLMDVEVWTIEPGRESDGFYAHEGEELIYVVEGQLEITLAGRAPVTLQAGDSAYFNSRIDHRWRNTSADEVSVLWVNTDSGRLGAMQFERRERRLQLGTTHGTGMGEGELNIDLPAEAETYRVVETHTAGHPTRILLEPLEGLDGNSVEEKRRAFEAKYDHLRSMLLQEPRGHAGSFGLVPVRSAVADFGAFFITSYGYPRFCGHAVFGYAKALEALGRLTGKKTFTIEMPGATVMVDTRPGEDAMSIVLPEASVASPVFSITVGGRRVATQIVDGGNRQAMVDAAALGLRLEASSLDAILECGQAVREALPDGVSAGGVDAVLFYETIAPGRERLFLAIDRHRYDRSPGVTGIASRLAQLVADGSFGAGSVLEAESIFGGRLQGQVVTTDEAPDGHLTCVPKISGRAHLNGISTLVLEPDDPLRRGFLG